MFSLITIIMMIFTQVLTALIFSKFPQWIRYGLYALSNMIVVTGAMFIIYKFLPNKMSTFGIYLPLLAVNPVITRQCELVAVFSKASSALKNAIASSLGYALIVMIVGFIKGLWGAGKIFGNGIDSYITSNAAFMPFTGFIILAFLAALLRIYFRKIDPMYAEELTVRSRSSLKSRITERAKPTEEKINVEENNETFDKKKENNKKIEIINLNLKDEKKEKQQATDSNSADSDIKVKIKNIENIELEEKPSEKNENLEKEDKEKNNIVDEKAEEKLDEKKEKTKEKEKTTDKIANLDMLTKMSVEEIIKRSKTDKGADK